eukprot:790496-Prorocentrum_minimum.AAC.1
MRWAGGCAGRVLSGGGGGPGGRTPCPAPFARPLPEESGGCVTDGCGIFLSRGCDWSVDVVYSYRGDAIGRCVRYIPITRSEQRVRDPEEAVPCAGLGLVQGT